MPLKILKGLGDLLAGDGLVAKGLDFINERWPPNMSEQDKAQMEIVVKDMLHKQNMDIMDAARDDEQMFNERTIALEGTASDLKSIPYVGALVIFARGMFRPVFSYMTMYIDWVYFSTDTTSWTQQQETLLFAMNMLVLIFFFGERAIKNIMPALMQVFVNKEKT